MDHLLTTVLLLALATSAATAAEYWFVRDGRPVNVETEGADLAQIDGAVTLGGVGKMLWGAAVIGDGDATIRARLRIEGLRHSAASLVIDGASHFGFEGGGGTMFVEGPALGGETVSIGDPVVEEGEAFDLEARLRGDTISFFIDGREVHQQQFAGASLGLVGLRPHRATLFVESFMVESEAMVEDWKPLPHTAVFTSGADGYHTYRIPALIVSSEGTLLAFAEGRRNNRSDHGDIDMMLRRSTDGGATWEPLQLVYEEGGDAEITIGNPCPVVDRETGRIWLPFCRDNDDVLVTYSDDDGLTWAEPREITPQVKPEGWGWYATGPGVGIQLQRGEHAGRLLIPCDHRERIDGAWRMFSHAFFSDDHGETWQVGANVGLHTDECQAVELTDARVLMNCRNYWERTGGVEERGGMRAVALSEDGGETWGDLHFDDALEEPVCQASLIRYSAEDMGDDRSRLIFANPASSAGRTRMTVRVSYDEGETWPVSRLVNPGSSAYSSLTRLPDGRIGLLYECDDYREIAFVAMELGWLEEE